MSKKSFKNSPALDFINDEEITMDLSKIPAESFKDNPALQFISNVGEDKDRKILNVFENKIDNNEIDQTYVELKSKRVHMRIQPSFYKKLKAKVKKKKLSFNEYMHIQLKKDIAIKVVNEKQTLLELSKKLPIGYKINPSNVEAKSRSLNFVFQPSIYEKAKEKAEKKGISLSEYLYRVLEKSLIEE